MQFGVLAYARDHRESIENDMLQSIQHRAADDITIDHHKRKELSKAAIKTCTTTKVKVKVMF